jgi:hypothetical protein
MPELDSLVRSVSSTSSSRPFSPFQLTLAAAAICGLTVGAMTLRTQLLEKPDHAAHCALPGGITLEALAPREQALVVRRAMLCSDVEHGRIDATHYLAALAALEKSPLPPALTDAPPAMIWASAVRELSSQYSAYSWSAQRALGAPDVPQAGGDHVNAWASLGADDRPEFLEVTLARPAHLSAVEIYETFNAGAVNDIVLIGASGRRTPLVRMVTETIAAPLPASRVNRFDLQECTDEPIVAIRVNVDSQRVAGWNEIDAIGGQPCQ